MASEQVQGLGPGCPYPTPSPQALALTLTLTFVQGLVTSTPERNRCTILSATDATSSHHDLWQALPLAALGDKLKTKWREWVGHQIATPR